MQTYSELREKVEQNGGVFTVEMRTLRQIHGAERLGINVRENITRELAGHGLAHFPRRLPEFQDQYARIYKQGTPAAELILAVLEADPQKDSVIRKVIGGNGADDTLRKIRELLEE